MKYLSVILLSALACSVTAARSVYIKCDTWAETMEATQRAYAAAAEPMESARTRLDFGRSDWYLLKKPLKAPKGKSAFDFTLPPEQETRFNRKNIEWENDTKAQDGKNRSLPIKAKGKNDSAVFMARKLTAHRATTADIWLKSETGRKVFLNGTEIAAQKTSSGKPERISLPLQKGPNLLVVKLAPYKKQTSIYFSFYSPETFFDEAAELKQIQQALQRDFPVETLSFYNFAGYGPDVLEKWLRHGELGSFGFKLPDFGKLAQQNAPTIKGLPPIAFVKRKNFGMRGTNATMFGHRTDQGSAICLLSSKGVKTIFETKQGFIFDISPSYDGKKLVMSYKPTAEDPFHVWEISADGSGLRQLTDGPWHDFNPVYYPDGRIVFCSSRVESYSLCQNYLAAALYTCRTDGSDIRRIDFTTLCSISPAIMPDGSIICSRWEYQDKNIFSWQGLWTIRPDGRQLKLYYGNTLTVPNSLYGPEPVPNTGNVVFTMAGHHRIPVGDIAIVDRSMGVENPAAMRPMTRGTRYEVTADKTWRDEQSWRPGDILYNNAFADPMPLDENRSIVSFAGAERFHSLYLLDYRGFMTPLYSGKDHSCFSAVPLAPRQKPSIIEGDCTQEPGEGTFFVQDVYQGLQEQGVKRGEVKALRIVRPTPKKYNTEGPRYHDHYPLVGYGSYYVKENLGTVPVDANGSAYFKVPSNCELYFIALDKDGKEIQRMGSVTQITTGEQASCIGCHEDRLQAPNVNRVAFSRLKRAPDSITPPPWGAGAFDYVKHVQPVLDRYCIECHEGRAPKGGIDLSGDKNRFYSMSYETLTYGKFVDHYYINHGPTGVFRALETGSWTSKLTKMIEEKHGDVEMDDESRRRIYAWIDSNAQYYSCWDMSRPYTYGGRDTWSYVENNQRGKVHMESWLVEFKKTFDAECLSCHKGFFNLAGKLHPEEVSWINLTRPEFSRVLNAHVSKEDGGMGIPMVGKKATREFQSLETTQAMLSAIEKGKTALEERPRMDMEGGTAIAQERDFGKVF